MSCRRDAEHGFSNELILCVTVSVCACSIYLSLTLSCFILSTYFMGRIIKLNLRNTPVQEPMQWNNFSNSITTLTWLLHCIPSTMKIFLSKWTWTFTFDIQIYRNKSKSNDNIDHFSMESCLFEIEFSFDILSFLSKKDRRTNI